MYKRQVESPTPNVPGRLYGKTDPDTGVQLPGRVGGGRIQEHILNQIIQEELEVMLNEQSYAAQGQKAKSAQARIGK